MTPAIASVTASIASSVKASLRAALGQAGIEVRRTRPPAPAIPPPLYDDPLEALYLTLQNRRPVAFKCPTAALVSYEGFGFAPEAWHPLVAATRELDRRGPGAAAAFLDRYYALHRPRSAAEAYLGFDAAPPLYRSLPPQLLYLPPWEPGSVDEARARIARFIEADNREHGRGDLTAERDGFLTFGPVTPAKRELELRRLARLYAALTRTGFDRAKGECECALVKRGREFRCVPGPGYHRAAVAVALDAAWVPMRCKEVGPFFVDVAYVEYWPQVRSGLWSRRQALAYVDYLFEYDAAEWAGRHAPALGLQAPDHRAALAS
jgi:hypothetical protein